MATALAAAKPTAKLHEVVALLAAVLVLVLAGTNGVSASTPGAAASTAAMSGGVGAPRLASGEISTPDQSLVPAPGGWLPQVISCPTQVFCMGLDLDGYAFSETDGNWVAPQEVLQSGITPNAEPLSCASASFCAAVDDDGNAYIYNGQGWSHPVRVNRGPPDLYQGRYLGAVSCPIAGYCVALGSNGFSGQEGNEEAFTYSAGHWSGPVTLVSGTYAFTGFRLACPTTSFCMATAPEHGMVL
jgi:hypothetical protein